MRPEPTRIQAVLFDLGGTLVDTRDFDGWAEDGRAVGLQVGPEDLGRAWEEAAPWREHREDSREALWRDVLSRATSSAVGEDVVRRFLARQERKPLHGALFSDVRRCLELLTDAGRRLGIVSNSRSEASVRELLGVVGIGSFFGPVVSSGTEGVRKPDPEIFRRALDRIHAPASATLFVGDDLENDVRAPIATGLHAVWLNRQGSGEDGRFPEILSLSEVPRVVRLLEAGAPVK
jgi:putative hydrolase of the HAD superfamily